MTLIQTAKGEDATRCALKGWTHKAYRGSKETMCFHFLYENKMCTFEGISFANKMFRSHQQNHHMKPAEWKQFKVSFSRSVFCDIFCGMSAIRVYLDRWDCSGQFLKECVDSVCGMSAVHIYLDRWDCLSQFFKECVLILCVACLSGQVGLFKSVSQGVCAGQHHHWNADELSETEEVTAISVVFFSGFVCVFSFLFFLRSLFIIFIV